jgi:hypothetical protein
MNVGAVFSRTISRLFHVVGLKTAPTALQHHLDHYTKAKNREKKSVHWESPWSTRYGFDTTGNCPGLLNLR